MAARKTKKKQGYDDRLDESLGETRGKASKKKTSKRGRRDESRGARKKKGSFGFGKRKR